MCHLFSEAEYTNKNYNTKFNTESNITCEMSLSLLPHSFPITPENMSITIHFICYYAEFAMIKCLVALPLLTQVKLLKRMD